MAKKWLEYVNLSDSYEKKARFLPAILSALPLVFIFMLIGSSFQQWIKWLLSGVGLSAIVSVGISHLASAFGNRMQIKLWPDWPHDSPTNRALHPDDKTKSSQQKHIWYEAIKKVTGLDIQKVIDQNNPEELKATINDSVAAVRNKLWKAPEGKRVGIHNIDYGFARNLTGMRLIWLIFAFSSSIASWTKFIWFNGSIEMPIISTAVFGGALLLAYLILPGYVRKKAEYYSESFFAALVELSNKKTN